MAYTTTTAIPFNCRNWLALGAAIYCDLEVNKALQLMQREFKSVKKKSQKQRSAKYPKTGLIDLPVKEIIEMRKNGAYIDEIAKQFDVSRYKVWCVLNQEGMTNSKCK